MKKPESRTLVIKNDKDKARAMQLLANLEPSDDNPYLLKISKEDESRSLKQNRLSFMWYELKGAFTGHGSVHERAVCKLHYGIPILRKDKDFNAFYTAALIGLTYDQKLKSMDYVPVTSLMSVKQFAEYLTTIDNESAKDGNVLPHPEDLYWDALLKDSSRV